jgi:hypothetical protein
VASHRGGRGVLEYWIFRNFGIWGFRGEIQGVRHLQIPRFHTLGVLEFEELITSESWSSGGGELLKFQDSKGLTETTKAPRVDLRRVKNCAKGSISNQVIGHLVFVFKTVLTEVDHIERQVYETFRILARTRKSSTSRP